MHGTVEGDRLEAKHIIAGHPVAEAVSATSIHGDIAAERADRAAGRIWRIKQAVGQQRRIELIKRDTAFRFAPKRIFFDGSDSAECGCVDHDTALSSHRAT